MGGNADEGTLFLHQIRPKQFPLDTDPNITAADVRQILREMATGLPEVSDRMLDQIIGITPTTGVNISAVELRHRLTTIIGDFLFKCPVVVFADALQEWPNGTDVYMYYFTQRSGRLPEWVGSSHFEEVQYVFGLPLRYPNDYDVEHRVFSLQLIKTWTHFATTGKMLPQMGINWPKYSSESGGQHMFYN
ncbi:unnamed protein product [Medioppia subpectinata]|uniref:Carboxylesterase type B domain-containing protein n=1 Tax=Medioppia subpectinata TaxID=1979941 RepID=A0A7R9KD66_9ACAR|nr:unnamed protein product [Medioppia subpectinata]CAG2101328.1 unnamed protein product [Medioppia subpectinata]